MDVFGNYNVNGSASPDMNNISPVGKQNIINIVEQAGIIPSGTVNSVNTITPVSGNVTITTSNIAEGSNLYFTTSRGETASLSELELLLPNTQDILYNNDGTIGNFSRPLTGGKLLGYSTDTVSLSTFSPVNGTNTTLSTSSSPNTFQYSLNSHLNGILGIQLNGVDLQTTLNSLLPVVITTPSSNQIIEYNGAHWVNANNTLSNLHDVSLTTPANGNVLVYNGANWINYNIAPNIVQTSIFTANGQLLYGTGSGTYTVLPVGTTGQFLYVNSGIPTWVTPTCDMINQTSTLKYFTTALFNTTFNSEMNALLPNLGQFLVGTGSGSFSAFSPGTNGQILACNSSATYGINWINSPSGSLSGLSDVALSSPVGNNLLVYNGTKWINSYTYIKTCQDYAQSGVPPGYNVMAAKGDNTWMPYRLNTDNVDEGAYLYYTNARVLSYLQSLSGGTTTGNILNVNSSTSLNWITPPLGTLSSLTDVSLTSLNNKQIIMYDTSSTKWMNYNMLLSNCHDTQISGTPNNYTVLTWTGTLWQDEQINSDNIAEGTTNKFFTNARVLSYLTGLSGFSNNNVLTANSTSSTISWVAPAGGTLSGLSDVSLTSPVGNNLLVYNGSKWVNSFTYFKLCQDYVYTGGGNPTGNYAIMCVGDGTVTPRQIDTSMVVEQSSNLYFTNARVLSYLQGLSGGTTTGNILNVNSSTTLDWIAPLYSNLGDITYNLQTPVTGDMMIYSASLSKWTLYPPTLSTGTYNLLTDVSTTSVQNGDVLMYNSGTSKWINSNQLTTAQSNITTLTTNVNALTSAVISVTINPAPGDTPTANPYVFQYNEINNPIVASTYAGQAGIIPLDSALADARGEATYITYTSNMPGTPYGNYASSTLTNIQKIGCFATGGNLNAVAQIWPTFISGTSTYLNISGTYCYNINYTNNPLTPGTYTLAYHVKLNNGQTAYFYGMHNQTQVTTEMGNLVQPTTGSSTNWDALGSLQPSGNESVNTTNYTSTNTYYLIRIYITNGAWEYCACIGANTTIHTNDTFANSDMTLGIPGSSSLTVMNNRTTRTSESWVMNANNLINYYIMNFVANVIRGTNTLNLNNTVFADNAILINNTDSSNVFKFVNSGLTSILEIDATNNKVIIPGNRYINVTYDSTTTVLYYTISATNTWFEIGNWGTSTVTVGGSGFTFSNTTGRITINYAGYYKYDCSVSATGISNSQMLCRLGYNGSSTFCPGMACCGFTTGIPGQGSWSGVYNMAASSYVSLFINELSGSLGTTSVFCISITLTPMFTS